MQPSTAERPDAAIGEGEGRFVSVRGLDPELNAASINGTRVPAPESDVRSVALDVIPAELIESIEVKKSLTPDMDGDTIGASIEINTVTTASRGLTANVTAAGPIDLLDTTGGLRVLSATTANGPITIAADVGASNGVIHAIDTVLVAPERLLKKGAAKKGGQDDAEPPESKSDKLGGHQS